MRSTLGRGSVALASFTSLIGALAGCGDDKGTGVVTDTAVDSAPDDTQVPVDTEPADTGPGTDADPDADTVDTTPTDTTATTGTTPTDTGVPDTAETSAHGFGSPCTGNPDCDSGYCVEGPEGFICSRTCDESCEPGFDCKGVAQQADVVFLCLPRLDKLCAPCAEDLQCQGGACLTIDGEKRCATRCGGPEDCPDSFTCTTHDELGGLSYCEPATASCTCFAEFDGGLRTCQRANTSGTCFGVETCDTHAGWHDCSARVPAPETCNAQDDDCDAFVDEDLSQVGTSCAVSIDGVGTCAGTNVCAGAAGIRCQAPTPKAETCNFEDDNCDGHIDEPFKQGEVYADYDHCGTCGRSCGVGFPNAQQTTCEVNQGVAQCVVVTCEPGFIKQNDFQCIPDVVNLCEPCSIDANCLGQGSRCVTLPDGQFCAKACTGNVAGECPLGFGCQAVAGGNKQCLPTTGVCSCGPSTQGLSRACAVTVAPAGQPSYTCAGAETCGAAGWGACALPAEICNGVDDDCDASTDEGFRDAQGRYNQVAHCGSCDISCTALTFENATTVCELPPVGAGVPQCGYDCKAGWVDVDGLPGCECHPTSAGDLPDAAGLDANCDGIDGEIGKSVFVAKTGNDAGAGTIDDPLRTIQAGIDRAFESGKRDVLVATGVYTESVALANNVSVYGGYAPDFHERDAERNEAAIIGHEPTDALRGAVNAVGIGTGAVGTTTFDGFSVFGADNPNAGGNAYAVYLRNVGVGLTVSHNTVVAGNGGAGGNGTKGGDGTGGKPGVDGAPARWVQNTTSAGCTAADHAAGGSGGSNVCGGASTAGGLGGTRICPAAPSPVSSGIQTPDVSEYGLPGLGDQGGDGLGGDPGWDQRVAAAPGCGTVGQSNTHGPFGLDGDGGSRGSDGGAGAMCMADNGSVNASGQWVSVAAGVATDGQSGGGGGGGGAGGGVDVHTCALRAVASGSGGGGGAGGCGGTAGDPGTSGGGSFGIFIAYAATPAGLPTVTGNTILRGRGGGGGAGGVGGVGGSGGLPGKGGPSRRGEELPLPAFPFNCCSSGGGTGGAGGSGGHGAGGAGGCGGASFGIYLDGRAAGLSKATLQNNDLPAVGAGGVPGVGGFSLGNVGPNGTSGLAAPTNY